MTKQITWQRTVTYECSGDIELQPGVTPERVTAALNSGLYVEDGPESITVYRDRHETEPIAYIRSIEIECDDESDEGFIIEHLRADFGKVIEALAARYPGTVDYNTEDGDTFVLLGKGDRVIATVDEREMTAVWNAVE